MTTPTNKVTTTTKAAKSLKKGDKVKSLSGAILIVSSVKNTENSAIVVFNGDLEIDFRPYHPIVTLDN
jgi:preprotein translocase subunit YajC